MYLWKGGGMKSEIHFGVNLYDKDGDIYETGIYLFIGDQNTIIRFDDSKQLEIFADKIKLMLPEIKENEYSS